MDAVIELQISTKLKDRFELGQNCPEPLVMEDGSVVMINSHIHLAVISPEGKIDRVLQPVQRTFISDSSAPIFREVDSTCVVAFYPDSLSIFSFYLEENDSNCQQIEFSNLYFAPGSDHLIPGQKEVITDWNFFYSAGIQAYYFVVTVLDSSGSRLINRIYRMDEKSSSTPVLIDSYESANRPFVQQTNEAIVFGMMKNHELIVLIERRHQKPLRLLMENFMKVSIEDQTIARMIVSVGLIQVQSSTLLMILFNDDLMQAGSQFLDITSMNMPPGQDLLPLHREDKSRPDLTSRNSVY